MILLMLTLEPHLSVLDLGALVSKAISPLDSTATAAIIYNLRLLTLQARTIVAGIAAG